MNKWIVLWYTQLEVCFSVRSWRIGRYGFSRKQDRSFWSLLSPSFSHFPFAFPSSTKIQQYLSHHRLPLKCPNWNTARSWVFVKLHQNYIRKEDILFASIRSRTNLQKGSQPMISPMPTHGELTVVKPVSLFLLFQIFKKDILTHNICLCYKDTKVYTEGEKPYPQALNFFIQKS